MPLLKTTIVPDADATPVLNEPVLKLIVIGNRPGLVDVADELAQSPPFIDRKVIWYKESLPAELSTQYGIAPDVKAFSLATGNIVGAKLLIPDAEDHVGVEYLYTKAGVNS